MQAPSSGSGLSPPLLTPLLLLLLLLPPLLPPQPLSEWFTIQLVLPFSLLSSLSGDTDLMHRFDGDFWTLGWAGRVPGGSIRYTL